MKPITVWLLGLSFLLFAGCTATYPAPGPLELSDASYKATDDDQLAIAIDASGVKHIARAECRTDTNSSCRVIYETNQTGRKIAYHVFSPAWGYSYRNPDVAVTDSGNAIITWQKCPAADPNSRLCVTYFARSSDLNVVQLLEVGPNSLSAPIVVSRGEVIYAVHEVTTSDTSSGLRFCRVSDLSVTCHWASDHPDDGARRMDAAAAVSGSGSLHVAWLAGAGSVKTGFINDNYGAINADMAHQLQFPGVDKFLPPAMAIETNDQHVYTAMAIDGITSDRLLMYYCVPSYCGSAGGVKELTLDPAKAWSFFGKPSIASENHGWAAVVFSAMTTDHPTQSDLYWSNYTAGGSFTSLSRLYPTTLVNGDHDCDPVVAFVEGIMTIGWHICSFPPTRDDIYLYDTTNGGRIIHASNYAGRGGFDMAVNGEYVAGAWNEIQTDGRVATWLAFNSHMIWLPAIRK